MEPPQERALERLLEALIAGNEGEAFMAVARKIETEEKRRVRIRIEPPLDNPDETIFSRTGCPISIGRKEGVS